MTESNDRRTQRDPLLLEIGARVAYARWWLRATRAAAPRCERTLAWVTAGGPCPPAAHSAGAAAHHADFTQTLAREPLDEARQAWARSLSFAVAILPDGQRERLREAAASAEADSAEADSAEARAAVQLCAKARLVAHRSGTLAIDAACQAARYLRRVGGVTAQGMSAAEVDRARDVLPSRIQALAMALLTRPLGEMLRDPSYYDDPWLLREVAREIEYEHFALLSAMCGRYLEASDD